MSGTITIETQENASKLITEAALPHASALQRLALPGAVKFFWSVMHAQGYLIGTTQKEVLERFAKSWGASGKPNTNGIEWFEQKYAYDVVLARAALRKLPIDLIKKQIEVALTGLYQNNIVMGWADAPTFEKIEKIRTVQDGALVLHLK